MSVALSLILPNECYNIDDNKLALEVFNQTIDRVISYFGGRKQFVSKISVHNSDSDDWGEYEDLEDEYPAYSFDIPLLNASCRMRQGFWDIWINARYKDYFWPMEFDKHGYPYLWARDDAFDAARIFGFTEGWVCDEFHSWNSELVDREDRSFASWLTFGADEEDAKVYEFDISMFGGKADLADYETKYHDSFKECFALVEEFEQRFPQYKLLMLGRPSTPWCLVAKGEELFVVNRATGQSLTDFPIDNCEACYNGAGFTIFKGEASAFFSPSGEQLTDYRVGPFKWSWSKGEIFRQVITDVASGAQFYNDGTKADEEPQS